MVRRADFNFERRDPEQANFRFSDEGPIKAIFKIAPPTVNYELLINKPKINHIELIGDKSLEDLGITAEIIELIAQHNTSEEAHEFIRNLIAQEVIDREAADTLLDGKIIQEILDRKVVDNQLQTNIDNEARDRQIEDSNLNGKIVNEALLRENADAQLQHSIDLEAQARTQADTTLGGRIDGINALIPSEATTSNKLADKDYVLDIVKTNAASFRGSWATWAAVPINPDLYPEDAEGNRTPDDNDYMIVLADETQDGGTWKYVYTGTWATDGKSGWLVEYQIEKTPFTPEQQAAIDSGITSTLVGQITTNQNDITDINTTLNGLATVASTGDYNDLLNKPTIGDGTLTIQVNGIDVQTFTANQTTNVTANIEVPDSATWGNITGTLSNQTDLQQALNSKIGLTDLSSSATGLNYNNETGVFSLTSGYVIPEQTTLNNLQRNFTFAELGITKTTSSYSTIDLAKEIAALKLDMSTTVFGEVTLNDMPTGIGNAEIKVEVQQRTGSLSVLAFTLTSTNVAPHEWTFYWVGSGTSGAPSTTSWYATVREDMVLTRTNTSSYTPSGDYNPATKKYVDDSLPTVNNGTLTIQLNGVALQTFTANQSSSVTANITALQTSDIINTTNSEATDKALSANMGKSLQDQVDNLKARGRFLALWNCATGLAQTNPPQNTYDYKAGDYFIVGTVASSGGTNYKPTGSSYTTGVASTVVETSNVAVDDVYYYDGTQWALQINTQKEVTFVSIAGDPYDNTNLASALNAKQNELTEGTGIDITNDVISNSGVRSISTGATNGTISVNTGGTSAEVSVYGLGSAAYTASTDYATSAQGTLADSALQPNDNVSELVNDAGYITGIAWGGITGTLADQTDLKNALDGKQATSTAVTHTASTAVGSATQPVYIASDGTATATTYALNKTVPSDAVFTDTTYSQGTGIDITNNTISAIAMVIEDFTV